MEGLTAGTAAAETQSAVAPRAGPLRIAVVGAGARAQDHLAAITRLPQYWRLAGVCDVRPDRATAAGQQFGAPAYQHPIRLLEESRPDALFVVVPPDGHHPLVLAAAERGVHVITEVPISISLPLADLMIDTCTRHGVVLEVAENIWRRPVERVRQEVLRRGLLGPPTLARLSYTTGSYHGLSVVCAGLQGPAAQVWGWRHDLPTLPYRDITGLDKQAHDWEFGVFRWSADETSGHPGLTLLYEWPPRPGGRNAWEIVGPRGRAVSDPASLEVSLFEPRGLGRPERRYAPLRETTTVDGVEVLARVMLPMEPPVIWENPLRHLPIPAGPAQPWQTVVLHDERLVTTWQLVSFYRAIVEHTAPEYGAAAARRDLEMLVALRASAWHGSVPIALPLRTATDHECALHEAFRHTYGHDPITEWREAIARLYPRGGITHGVVAGVAR